MKKIFLSLFVTSFILLLFTNIQNITAAGILFETADSNAYKKVESIFNEEDAWVEGILSKMTMEEKAAQLVFPYSMGYGYEEGSYEYKQLVHLVRDRKVGGILFFTEDMLGQAIMTNKLQRLAKIPLLITADYEKGISPRTIATVFPSAMGIGAADDTRLTYEMGRIISMEARALGVHQNYSPVVDVNNNPLNPIINTRSFGEDVDMVKRLSTALIKGLQDEGMIATVKHFPGHGNTATDSHNDIPFIEGTKCELDKLEFAPFQNAVSNGVMSVMIGHLGVPVIDNSGNPASLSKKIITGLLKNEMKFKGLIVTDAMDMRAITKMYSHGKAAALAILAGNDVVLMPANPEKAIDGIINAVKKGEISKERLNYSVRKILHAKKYAGLDKNKISDISKISEIVGIPEHWAISEKLAQKTITLLKDEDKLIPLVEQKIMHIAVIDSKDGMPDTAFNHYLSGKINDYMPYQVFTNSSTDEMAEILDSAKGYETIILSTYVKVRPFAGNLGISADQADFMHKVFSLGKKVLFASHGSPYILSAFPEAKTYICNYGDNRVVENALAKAIIGEHGTISGKLPVSIPGTVFNKGSGIQLTFSSEKEPVNNGIIDFEKVDKLITKAVSDTVFPGGVLMVLKDGVVLHKQEYGSYTYEANSQPFTMNTLFDLASVSKVIATTTAVMLCVDRGLIKLDEKVSHYIPAFSSNGKGDITVLNLMLHNSGLPAGKNFYKPLRTAKEVIKEIYNEELVYPTGTKMVYSDLGMITVGKIIEKVSGKTLDKFCRDEIFIPLCMTNTFYNPSQELRNRIAPTENDNYWRNRQLVGEVHDEAASILNGVAGHAGLFSTAEDLSILLQMLLQKGEYNGKRFIDKETVELFVKQYSDLSSRGIGWDTKSPEGSSCGTLFSPNSYGHTGYTGTSVWTDPERRVIVIFLTNRVQPTRENTKIIRFRPVLHDQIIKVIDSYGVSSDSRELR